MLTTTISVDKKGVFQEWHPLKCINRETDGKWLRISLAWSFGSSCRYNFDRLWVKVQSHHKIKSWWSKWGFLRLFHQCSYNLICMRCMHNCVHTGMCAKIQLWTKVLKLWVSVFIAEHCSRCWKYFEIEENVRNPCLLELVFLQEESQ